MLERPSRTAQSVALGVVATSHDPRWSWLAPPEVVEPIRACLHAVPGLLGAVYRRIETPLGLRLIRRMERRTIPGAGLNAALRKRWLEQQVRQEIAAGATQVVVIGAGFDPLAWRLHQLEEVTCWEIDRAATQAVKRVALSGAGGRLRFLPADLSHAPLDQVLNSAGFSPAARSAFVVEGLLMYLPDEAVTAMFRTIHRLLLGGGVVLGTSLAPLADGRLAIAGAPPWVNWRLRLTGEPFRFGLPPERFRDFVTSLGFDSCDTRLPGEALREVAPPDRPAGNPVDLGEYLFRALAGPRRSA